MRCGTWWLCALSLLTFSSWADWDHSRLPRSRRTFEDSPSAGSGYRPGPCLSGRPATPGYTDSRSRSPLTPEASPINSPSPPEPPEESPVPSKPPAPKESPKETPVPEGEKGACDLIPANADPNCSGTLGGPVTYYFDKKTHRCESFQNLGSCYASGPFGSLSRCEEAVAQGKCR